MAAGAIRYLSRAFIGKCISAMLSQGQMLYFGVGFGECNLSIQISKEILLQEIPSALGVDDEVPKTFPDGFQRKFMDILAKTDFKYQELSTPKILQELFHEAGVRINGPNPWDIQVHDPLTYSEILSKWSLGMGESYMDGRWDCEKLDEMEN